MLISCIHEISELPEIKKKPAMAGCEPSPSREYNAVRERQRVKVSRSKSINREYKTEDNRTERDTNKTGYQTPKRSVNFGSEREQIFKPNGSYGRQNIDKV